MELTMEIICENFEQKKISNNKVEVDEPSEEYYIIPLNKSFSMEYDDEIFKLTFKNQLLWLKYSNHSKNILIKDYNFTECVLIKSEYIYDIYLKIHCNNLIRKNVWHSNYNINLKKKYIGKYFLAIPVIEDMISVKEYGEGISNYQIHMITNEVLLKKVDNRSDCAGNLIVTNNFRLNKEALFIRVSDDDVGLFLE